MREASYEPAEVQESTNLSIWLSLDVSLFSLSFEAYVSALLWWELNKILHRIVKMLTRAFTSALDQISWHLSRLSSRRYLRNRWQFSPASCIARPAPVVNGANTSSTTSSVFEPTYSSLRTRTKCKQCDLWTKVNCKVSCPTRPSPSPLGSASPSKLALSTACGRTLTSWSPFKILTWLSTRRSEKPFLKAKLISQVWLLVLFLLRCWKHLFRSFMRRISDS